MKTSEQTSYTMVLILGGIFLTLVCSMRCNGQETVREAHTDTISLLADQIPAEHSKLNYRSLYTNCKSENLGLLEQRRYYQDIVERHKRKSFILTGLSAFLLFVVATNNIH